MAPGLQNERLEGLQAILKNLEVESETESHSLIISIDFGTTYSGVGYVFSSKPDQLHVITNWPGLVKGRVSPKVPTVMLYDRPSQFKWGFEVGQLASNKIEAFKLFLDPGLPKPLYTSAMIVQTELNRLKKTAVDVTRDFLRSLYQWTLTHIEDQHLEEYLEIVTVKFVVSMPAVWPEKARRATLQAARDAGIDPIVQIKEPEAAALFTLQSDAVKSAGLQIGDAVTVCDAGGGTVDLISYEIKKMKPLELIELASGTACLAGSLMLNKKFEDHLKSVIDEEEFFPLRKTDGFRRAMMKFDEEIKPDFVSSKKKTYFVEFPGAHLTDQPGLSLKSNRLTLTGDDLKRIFQPVVMEVNQAIAAQILSARVNRQKKNRHDLTSIKAIFLVGGFGANKHLREFVEEHHPGVKIIQPNKAWSAVVEGAMLWHAPATSTAPIASRSVPKWYSGSVKATRHYGIACSSIWDAELHASEAKYWDAWEGVWRCTTTTWCIKKGENLSANRRIALQFYKQCAPYPDEVDLAINAALKQSVSVNAPTTSTDASILTNCTVHVSLRTLPHALFHKKTRRSDGVDYWEISYELVLEVDKGSIRFWVEINGEKFGKRLVS